MMVVVCPGCHRRLQLADSPGGHEGQCAHCGRHVRLGGPRVDAARDTNDTASSQVPETGSHPPAPSRPAAPGYEFLAPPQLPDEIGRLGTHRVLQLLGQGAMGMVFRAEDTALGRIVALKVMIPSVASVAENRQRFLREAQATAKVNHPNVIPIYAVGEDRGVPYLAMPLLKGELLEARLNRERRPLIRDAVRISREIAEGLAAAHERNLVHRDIKPANLFLEAVLRRSASDRVKILDFGLARMGDTGLTSPGAVLGTPAYMAPEQAKGLTVDYRCDLFSLGSVMYRMLVGERAFQGNEVFAVLMALTTVHPPPPHEANPAVPQGLSQLVMHLLAKDPDDRPQSAAEVVERLNRMGLTSSSSSTDKMPTQRAGSSGSVPILASASGSTVATLNADERTPKPSASGALPARGTGSFAIALCAAVILLICLLAFLAHSLFGARPQGTVLLNISPPGSEVLVDSEAVQLDAGGSTALTLKPGMHHFKVLHKDYHGRTLDLEVVEGDNSPVSIELTKLSTNEGATSAPKQPEPAPERSTREIDQKPPQQEPAKENKPGGATALLKLLPTNESIPNLEKSAPVKPPEPEQPKVKVPEVQPERPPMKPPEAKENEAKAAAANPVPDRKESRPETAPVNPVRPPSMSIDRRAALWVLGCGGEAVLKRQGRATPDRVRNRVDLPKVRFDLVMAGLEKCQKVDDAGLAVLAGLRELTELDLSGTAVSNAGIANLRNLPRLQILTLRNTRITDGAVPDLILFDRLKNLDLQNTKISAGGLQQLKTALPGCDITEP
jgi:serine/threonine protein kinase